MNITAKKISMPRNGYTCRSAMTLIELIVAVAIMIMIVAGVGYVFSATAKTVRTAKTNAEINSSARSFAIQMREDMQRLDTSGFMAIVGPTAATPPMFMFTATGKFEPQRVQNGSFAYENTIANQPSNSAVIVYLPIDDKGGSGKKVLMRFVYRLVGRSEIYTSPAVPFFLGVQIMAHMNYESLSPFKAMVFGDYSYASINDVQKLVAYRDDWDASNNVADIRCVFEAFIQPYIHAYLTGATIEVNSSPLNIEEVEDLWPYLIGGLDSSSDSFAVDFYDGRNENNILWDQRRGLPSPDDENENKPIVDTANPVSSNDAWINVIAGANYINLGEKRMDPDGDGNGNITDLINTTGVCIGHPSSLAGGPYPVAIWTGRQLESWPKMLRFRLKQGDAASLADSPKDFEIIIPLRK